MEINLGIFSGVFAVPNAVVDECIKIASGDNLKVLLYCLRHSGSGGQAVSAGEIARASGISVDNVESSLEFWQQMMGRFSLSTESACVSVPVPASVPVSAPSSPDSGVKKAKALLTRDCQFAPTEIADIVKSSKDIEYFFQRAEDLYGKPLTHSQRNSLSVIVEEINMSAAVALMLIEYCFSIKKSNMRYIKKVAENWIEKGIDSVPAAEQEYALANVYHPTAVCKLYTPFSKQVHNI